MRRRYILGLTTLLATAVVWAADPMAEVPKPAPKIATGSWAEALKQHPRLIGTKDYLKARAKDSPRAYAAVKNYNDKGAAGADPFYVEALGIRNAIEGPAAKDAQDCIQDAMKEVAKGVTNDHQDTWIALTKVVTTYDAFYDQITPADRAKIIAFLNGHLGKFTIDENAFHNSTLSKINCYLKIAYGTSGENPRAREFRDYAIKLYELKVLPVIKQFGAGGGYTEGGWYTRSSLWHLVQGLELARRFEKYDGFALAAPFFYRRMAYELYQPWPGIGAEGCDRFSVEGDGANTVGAHTENPRQMRTVLAQYFRGSELAGLIASKQRRGFNDASRIVDFLYEEAPDAARPLNNVPLAHLAEGIGRVYARSDWTDDATWFRFDCGPYFTDHQHFDVGNFEIVRHEPLATESGEYDNWGDSHAVNYLARTVAHNCILVYDRSEKWNLYRGNARLSNDGGQWNPWGHVADTAGEWMGRQQQFVRGQIVAYDNHPEFLFVAANCTPAYNPAKLSLWVRQIVFVRPGTFVIFDRVVSRRADFPKAWLLHCRNEPEISGMKAGIKNGQGVLFVETLLPKGAKLTVVNGYNYPAFAGGEKFPAPESSQTKLANLWRVEVTPTKPAEEDIFVHVLSTHGPVDAKVTTEGGKMTVQAGNATVTFTGKVGGDVTIGGRKTVMADKVIKNGWE